MNEYLISEFHHFYPPFLSTGLPVYLINSHKQIEVCYNPEQVKIYIQQTPFPKHNKLRYTELEDSDDESEFDEESIDDNADRLIEFFRKMGGNPLYEEETGVEDRLFRPRWDSDPDELAPDEAVLLYQILIGSLNNYIEILDKTKKKEDQDLLYDKPFGITMEHLETSNPTMEKPELGPNLYRDLSRLIPGYQRSTNLITKMRDRFLEKLPMPNTKYGDDFIPMHSPHLIQKKYPEPPKELFVVTFYSEWACGCGRTTKILKIYAEEEKAKNYHKKVKQVIEKGYYNYDDPQRSYITRLTLDPATRLYT